MYIDTDSLLTFLKYGHLLLSPFQAHLIFDSLHINSSAPVAVIAHLILASIQILIQLLIALLFATQILVQLPQIHLHLSCPVHLASIYLLIIV